MILKAYVRQFTNDADASLALHKKLHGGEPHMDIVFGEWRLIAIGDVLIVGGTPQSLEPIITSQGPLIVDDLDATKTAIEAAGGRISKAIADAPTGRFMYAIHPDGCTVEYTEWTDELVEKWVRKPQRDGHLSSEM